MIDVMLLPKEILAISMELEHVEFDRPFAHEFGDRLAKAAQRKLLGVLAETCKEHHYCGWHDMARFNCPKCMAEVERLLNG